jgi:CRISPR type IV-associated protein Csf3
MKKTKLFTQAEYNILFDALDVYATEVHDARYNGEVDTYGTKREVQALLKKIKLLENKLQTL